MKRKKIHTHFGIHRDAGHRNDSVGGGDDKLLQQGQ